jgi:hypothetical protein
MASVATIFGMEHELFAFSAVDMAGVAAEGAAAAAADDDDDDDDDDDLGFAAQQATADPLPLAAGQWQGGGGEAGGL